MPDGATETSVPRRQAQRPITATMPHSPQTVTESSWSRLRVPAAVFLLAAVLRML